MPSPPSLPPLLPLARRLAQFLRYATPRAFADFRDHGLRWSYFALAGLTLVALGVNVFLPHGWTAWPFVIMAATLMYVHEAADRNGQGVPPGHVYGLFAGAAVAWIAVTLVLSVLNPFVVLAGVGYLTYYSLRAYLKDRAAKLLIARRRTEGLCVFCGEVADARAGICMNCGEEPDPDAMQTARVQAVVKNRGGQARMRAALKEDSAADSARKKEAALLARSRHRQKRK